MSQRGKRGDLVQQRSSTPPAASAARESPDDAGVLVSLHGPERSPEALVEVGLAMAGSTRLVVLDLTQVPEQTALDAIGDEEPKVRTLRRRLRGMAQDKHADIDFRAAVTRDTQSAVEAATTRLRCAWLVLEWEGRGRRALLPYNPLGWLINHLDTNLALFKDNGVRYMREILVYPQPGPHDALVLGMADHLATVWDAHVTLLRFVPQGAPESDLLRETEYLEELQELCVAPSDTKIVRGRREVEAVAHATGEADLLVMGAGPMTLWRTLLGTAQDRITTRAACSVLTLKTPRASRPRETPSRHSIRRAAA